MSKAYHYRDFGMKAARGKDSMIAMRKCVCVCVWGGGGKAVRRWALLLVALIGCRQGVDWLSPR